MWEYMNLCGSIKQNNILVIRSRLDSSSSPSHQTWDFDIKINHLYKGQTEDMTEKVVSYWQILLNCQREQVYATLTLLNFN